MTKLEYDLTVEYTDSKTPDYTYHFKHKPNIDFTQHFIVVNEKNRTAILHEREVCSIILSAIEVEVPDEDSSSRPEPSEQPIPLSSTNL